MSVNFFGFLIDQVCLPYHMFAKLGCTQCSAKEKSSPTVMLSLRVFMDKVTQERPLKMSNSQNQFLVGKMKWLCTIPYKNIFNHLSLISTFKDILRGMHWDKH